ncbi:MAG TPA: toll/interleukin-1 receptor domain-containing protein [Thermoanaerobaculia bacterium]
MPPLRIFLSYSHVDETWKNRLSGHLAVLAQEGLVDVWDDRRIGAGDTWEAEIRAAMNAAHVAILLISSDFLSSGFVRDSEVPHLLQRRAEEGVRLVPIVVHSCLWREVEWLAKLQVRPRDGKPLASLRGDRIDKELVAIAREVLKPPKVAFAEPHSPLSLPESEPREREGFRRSAKPKLLGWVRQKPAEGLAAAGGLGTALVAALAILGLLSERARERLIGIKPLSYPPDHLLLTGADSLWSLPWRALAAVAAPHLGLRWSAVALFVLAVALLAGGLFPRQGPAVLATLAASAGMLIMGAWLYSAAVHAGLETPELGYGLKCEGELSRRWDVSATFETCTWLTNDTPKNEKRRQGLGGVLGLLFLAASGAAWMGTRSEELGPRASWARWCFVAVHSILVLFFLSLLPAAHAYSTWGVRYPPLMLSADGPQCDQALTRAISAGTCCAFNVAEGGTEGIVLFLWGRGCPGGVVGMPLKNVGAMKECLTQTGTMQNVNSRCR